MNEPRVVSNRNTEYGIRSLSCLNDEDVWTCSSDSILRLYNLKGELVREIQTKSGNKPYDIAVTKNGDLVYTDNEEETVNILRNRRPKHRSDSGGGNRSVSVAPPLVIFSLL